MKFRFAWAVAALLALGSAAYAADCCMGSEPCCDVPMPCCD